MPMVETAEIELDAALADYSADPAGAASRIRSLQLTDKTAFARAAARALAVAEPSAGHQLVASLIVGNPAPLEMLSVLKNFTIEEATYLARILCQVELRFDVRWMRKVCQDHGDAQAIGEPLALRMLHVLGEVSDCTRLTPFLIQMMRHGSAKVRSKSVLLLGRGNVNVSRSRQFLTNEETRVRANIVESLWDQPMPGVQEILMQCSQDPHRRVAVNALVGLCRFGDTSAPKRLVELAESPDPVTRAGAAWGMGRGNHPKVGTAARAEFAAALERLARDEHLSVQNMAIKSLELLGPIAEVPLTPETPATLPEAVPPDAVPPDNEKSDVTRGEELQTTR